MILPQTYSYSGKTKRIVLKNYHTHLCYAVLHFLFPVVVRGKTTKKSNFSLYEEFVLLPLVLKFNTDLEIEVDAE